jgi:ribosomal protein L7Ae-like RNA K-turn-binding protein
MANKKHYVREVEAEPVDMHQKVLNLLQFARKAGKIVYGFEQSKRSIVSGSVKLVLLTNDIADNTKDKINSIMQELERAPKIVRFGTQEELSSALGVSLTCIVGILDNNFARKILSYLAQ